MAGPDLTGEVLDGRYRILGRISQGAMGVVYRGVRTNLGRQVAIKVMHVALPDAMKVRERFEREAQVMARLDHPHCVSIVDYGLHDNKPFVVMELVRGQSLHEMLVEQKRLEIPRAVELMRQILSGLAHAHEQGIVHRDIKPGNIMVTPKAPLGLHVRLLDFGLARIAEGSSSISDGVAVGTPSYMAPEQCRGEPVDVTVDIYACGIVLFEMLTGGKPLTSNDPITTIKMQMEQAPPRLSDVASGDFGELEYVVARALEKDPASRFPSATAMAQALDAAIGGRDAGESTASLPLRPTAPSSSRRWFVFALVLFALAAAGAAAYFFVIRPRDVEEPAPAPPPVPVVHDRVATVPVPVMVATTDPAADNAAKAKALASEGHKFFAKLWWTDGIASFRAAFKLDPTLRADPSIIDAAVKAFLTTPDYDPRLAGFVTELGSAAAPVLDEAAAAHRDPQIRVRATALAKRLR
ncbi:MAG: serine/threonine protein kinase [Deltaproteobacteria bacterium]|nr:serine/threonine protein kinase [Deltaproteobacteria bacterium]